MPDLDFGARPPPSGRSAPVAIEHDDAPLAVPLTLDGPTRGSGRAPVPAARTSSPQMSPDMGRGAMFDDDEDGFGSGGGAGLSLELDTRGGPPIRGMAPKPMPSAGPGASAGGGGGGGGAIDAGMAPVKMPSFRPIPAGVPDRRPSTAPVESYEAKMLGNFGEPPKHFWQAPLYAWRVRQRLADLKEALKERRQLAERAAKAIDQALVALGQRARGAAELNPQYGRTLDLLRMNEQTLRQKDGALMGEMDAHSRKLAQIDQKIAELQSVATQMQAEERRISDELNMAQATVQRAEAKLKRLDIDLRSAFGPGDPRRGGQ